MPLPALVVEELAQRFEVVGADGPGHERAPGRDRLLHPPAHVAAGDLALVDDRDQLQVRGAERDDHVRGASAGMAPAGQRLQPVTLLNRARALLEVRDPEQDVV